MDSLPFSKKNNNKLISIIIELRFELVKPTFVLIHQNW